MVIVMVMVIGIGIGIGIIMYHPLSQYMYLCPIVTIYKLIIL